MENLAPQSNCVEVYHGVLLANQCRAQAVLRDAGIECKLVDRDSTGMAGAPGSFSIYVTAIDADAAVSSLEQAGMCASVKTCYKPLSLKKPLWKLYAWLALCTTFPSLFTKGLAGLAEEPLLLIDGFMVAGVMFYAYDVRVGKRWLWLLVFWVALLYYLTVLVLYLFMVPPVRLLVFAVVAPCFYALWMYTGLLATRKPKNTTRCTG